MNNILLSAVLSYATDFFGIGLGALCAFLILGLKRKYIKNLDEKLKKNAFFSFVLEFSSGLMMAVVTFRLIPQALVKCGTMYTVAGILCGLVFVHLFEKASFFKDKGAKTSLVLLVNLWLHNIPEGFVMGNTSCSDTELMLLLFSAILLHNIPQGFLIALPSVKSGNIKWITTLTLLSGIPTALGAVIGALTGGVTPFFTGLMLSFASGSMLYVLIFELSYEAHKMYAGKITELFYIIGLIFGIAVL